MKRSTPITGAASRKKQRIVLPPAIKNVSVQQQEWRGGSQQTVRWASEGDVPTVDISLYKGDFYGKILVHHVPNSGTCIVTVPSGLSPANDYRVAVESTVNDNVSSFSGHIAINADATPPAIKSVSVQQPIWHSGTQQTVCWTSEGDVPKVDLYLRKKGDDFNMTVLKREIPNSGTYIVTVPGGLSPATNYRVQVESTINHDVLSRSGRISIGGIPPVIKNVRVQKEWRGGSQQMVRWASEGDVPTVDLLLRRKDDFFGKVLRSQVPNSGKYIVMVPAGLTPANDYRVQVESTINDSVSARSSRIAINADATPPAIKNVSVQQPIWHGGSQQMVRWTSEGDVPTVDLVLRRKGDNFIVKLLCHHVPNSGTCVVTVPAGLTPANGYRVEVESSVNDGASARSGAFTIDDEHRERCVQIAMLLLGLPLHLRLPYPILRQVCMLAATV